METGNPKQAALLGVLAVGAVGFLFTKLGGKPSPAVLTDPTVARREGKARPAGALTVGRDPFSHPRLATKPEKPAGDAALATGLLPPPKPMLLAGSFPAMGPLPSAETVAPVAVSVSSVEPPKAPKISIGLEAVAGASDAVAFLSVGGADSQPFRPKDSVAGAIRLLRVGDGTAVLEGPGGRVTLEVGERRSL